MNQIKRYEALLAVLFGLFVWGCSGEETNGNGTVAHGSATQIEETGGTMNETGGTGGDESTGGTVSETGGSDSTGGNQPTGGSAGEAGSLVDETGGTPSGGSAGNPTETGGVEATGGDESTGGSDPSTGGQESTGGSQETGGAQATGGVEETGGTAGSGSNPETGGTETGGVEETGGSDPTGGVEATGGSQETGGSAGEAGSPSGETGGTGPVCAELWDACELPEDCCSGMCYRNTCVDEMPKPHGCSKWERKENFIEGMDITSKLCANGPDDIYVATGTYGNAAIAHFNGSEWSPESLECLADAQYSRIDGIFCTGDDVWAVGMFTIGASTSERALIMHLVDGEWVVDTDFANALPKWSVVSSIWGANGVLYASVNVMDGSDLSRDARIYVNVDGSGWSVMITPEQDGSVFLEGISGTGEDDLFVTGDNASGAILWYYDGADWSDWSDNLPSEVVTLSAIDVNEAGEIFISGATHDGVAYHGVVLSSMNGVSWVHQDVATEHMNAVWSPAIGSVIASGSVGPPQTSGSARTLISSQSEWGEEQPFDGIAMVVTGILQIPGTTEVLQATYGEFMGEATVYSANCQ